MNKIYKLGMVGFGGMAGHHYTQLSKKNVPVEIGGVYDIKEDRMQAAREKGLKTYPSLDAMLSDPGIDIILIATYNTTHAELSKKALRAGKHVLCEKPVTVSSEELEDVMAVAKECGRVFGVDQNRRFNKDYILLRRALADGIIGTPYVIESRVEGSRGMPEGWRCQKELGGGMMLDWGVHLIDQIMDLCPEKVTSVFCKMYSVNYPEVDDNFRLTLTFEGGLTAQIEVSTNSFIVHPRWYVLGKNGTMQIDDWSCSGRIVTPIVSENTWDAEIAPDRAGPSKTMAKRSEKSIKTVELTAPTDVEDNLDPVYRQFINAVEGGELMIKPEQCLRVVKVMEAAFESARTGDAIHTEI